MSDFLKQFESANYKKINEQDSKPEKSANNTETIIKKKQISVEKEKPTFNSHVIGTGITTEEHETEVDNKYHKRKIILYITVAVTIVLVTIIGFVAWRFFSQITVRNFVGNNVSEAKNWGLKNKIEIDIQTEYSKEHNQDIVTFQEIEPNSKVQKGSVFYVRVSKGADPDEKMELPDFNTMAYASIREYIKQEKLNNANIVQEYNEDVENTKFIRVEFKEGVTSETYTRKDSMTVYVSRGSKSQDKNITVPDFSNKAKTEVETWAKEKEVVAIYKEAGSTTVAEGAVVSQSPNSGEKIAAGDTVEVTISLGKGIAVPNFANASKEEANTIGQGLMLNIKTKYNDQIAYGRLISQSVKSGTRLYKDNIQVELIYSEGKPYIGQMIGRTEKDIESYVYEMSTKGLIITYEFRYIDSPEPKGTVTHSSKENEYISMNQHIILDISKGNISTTPPINTTPTNII